jgi:hypothetical protein
MNRLILTLSLALACVSARAEFVTGNELLTRMNGDATARAFALAYVAGVHDSMRGIAHCSPESVTLGQVHDMTRQLLDRLPSDRHMSADQFVVAALTQAWPCEKPKSSRGA